MKKTKLLLITFLTMFLNSCQKESLELNSNANLENQVTIKNGRLAFQSKEAFAKIYREYADATDEKLSQYFKPLYEQGFYSLRPIVIENNEEFVYNHYMNLFSKTQNKGVTNRDGDDIFDYLDDLEDIIGDDAFAAFLNDKAEIQFADEIYKYTDVGLFISKENKYDIMKDLLDDKNISEDLKIETPEVAKQAILSEYPNEGLTMIDTDVSYFKIQPTDPENGGGGGYSPTPGAPSSTDPSYLAFLSNLSSCTPHSGIFGNLFGDNNVCIDRYENRRRVKTKAFNYNYLVVYHLGVKCVHQYRGWTGFWRVEATDEIRLVVEAAQFEYDLDALLGNNAVTNQTRERAYFMNNQKILFTGPNNIYLNPFGNVWNQPTYTNLNQSSLPQIFQDDLSFEFFSTGWDWLDNQIQNGIDNSLEASNLNNYFYNGLYSTATSQLRTALNNNTYSPPANRTFVAKFPQNGKMVFQKSVLNQGFGIGVRQNTFDWGAEIRLNVSTSGDSGWRMSGGTGNVLVRPRNFRVKIIGAARRGGGWHGSKFTVGLN